MYCRNCGKPMNDNQDICLNCGVKAKNGNKFCHNCGSSVNEQADYCINCGTALKNSPIDKINDLLGNDKIVMAIICFFLGTIGIHNFLMGETKKGIFKIIMSFVCGISVIFMLIDFIKLLTGKYVIEPDKFI